MLLSALPVVSIEASVAAASENGDSGQFVISRGVASATPLKVTLAVSGIARNGTDYAKIPTTVTIPADLGSVTVTIVPIDDGKTELAESVILAVKAGKTYSVDGASASDTVTIADATYLATDFFPLAAGTRWDYITGDGQAQYFECADVPDGKLMTFRSFYDGEWSTSTSLFQVDADGISTISENDGGSIKTYSSPMLAFPASMKIGDTYAGSGSYAGTNNGTIAGSLKVFGVETIKVAAGEFRALKVQGTSTDQQSGWVRQKTNTWWLVRGIGVVREDGRSTTTDSQSGRGSDTWTYQLTTYSPASTNWLRGTDMNVARCEFAGGLIEGKIYVFGGHGTDTRLKSTQVFDPAQNQWTPLASNESNAGEGVMELTGAVVGGKLYAFGAWGGTGSNGLGTAFNFVQKYDPDTDAWTPLAPKPTPVSGATCAVYNGEIYVFGGMFGYEVSPGKYHDTRYNVVEAYNPASDTWRLVARLPKMISGQALAVVGDKAYLMGGYTGSKLSSTTFSYDFTTGLWTQKGLAAMPRPRVSDYAASAAPVVDGKIWFIGGIEGSSAGFWASNRIDVYDPVANIWSAGPSLPKPVCGGYSLVTDGTMYVVGGETLPNAGDDHESSVADVWTLALT